MMHNKIFRYEKSDIYIYFSDIYISNIHIDFSNI